MRQQKDSVIDVLFTLALFCVFCASALLLVLIGANVYKGTVKSMSNNFNSRTVVSYISEKVRQNDKEGAVALGTVDGEQAIVLTDELNGQTYCTYIYWYDGTVRELMQLAGTEPNAAAGQAIADADSLSFEALDSGLWQVTVTGDGETEQMIFGTRSAAERGNS